MTKVSVDNSLCQGHGRCYEIAPAVFTDDDSGYCVIERPQIAADLLEIAESAARACPENAITLTAEA